MNSWSDTAAKVVTVVVILALATWAINRGGAGKQMPGSTLFRVRPGLVIMMLIVAALGVTSWVLSLFEILANHYLNALVGFLVGLPFILLAVYGSFQSVTLDAQGVRHNRRFLTPIVVPWAELDHFEIAATSIMHVLILRPRGEAQAIAVSSYGFNTKDLLRHINQHKPLRQLPMKRQRWYRY